MEVTTVGLPISQPEGKKKKKKGSGDLPVATRGRAYHDKDKSKDNAYREQQ